MIRTLIVTPLAALLLAPPVYAQEPDEAFLDAAYAACVAALTPLIAPTGKAPVEFAARERVQMVLDGEFRFAFSAGTITGATQPEPHPLTLMNDPAGSCSGSTGARTITQLVLNGEVVAVTPLEF